MNPDGTPAVGQRFRLLNEAGACIAKEVEVLDAQPQAYAFDYFRTRVYVRFVVHGTLKGVCAWRYADRLQPIPSP